MKGNRPPPDVKAEHRKTVLAALKNYHRGGSIKDRYAPALQVIVDESDRGAIILITGIMDDMLGERIVGNLRNGKDMRDDLLSPSGVLGWFQDRMTMALAMGLIDKETHDEIEILRQLRNKCSHTIGPVSLRQPPFIDVLGLLVDGLIEDHNSGEPVTDTYLRNALSFTMVFLVERLLGKSRAEAQQTVNTIVRDIWESEKASRETPTKQSDPEGRPDHRGEKP